MNRKQMLVVERKSRAYEELVMGKSYLHLQHKWSFVLIIVISILLFLSYAMAADSGTCGDDLFWELDDEGVLIISGTGQMTDYSSYGLYLAPWGKTVKSVQIQEGVESVGDYAFYYCDSLSQVEIPETVRKIGEYAFYHTNCSEIYIPSGIQTIGKKAFDLTMQLTKVEVSSLNFHFSSENGVLFDKSKSTLLLYPKAKTDTSYTVPDEVEFISDQAFMGNGYLTLIVLPETLKTIGNNALYNTKIVDITIPTSVISIGDAVFINCSKLQSINVEEDNQYYSSEDGVLFDKEKSKLITYPGGKSTQEYTVPDSVTVLENEAFYFSKATSVILLDGITSIGKSSFSGSRNLRTVRIPDSVTSIDDNAFNNCPNIEFICDGCESYAKEYAVLHNIPTSAGRHSFIDDPVYVWAEDNSQVTASYSCKCGEQSEEETVKTTLVISKEPTCIEKGETVYTSAAFDNEAFSIQTKTVEVDALGHNWGETLYEWSEDNMLLTAARVCQVEQYTETETVPCTKTVTVEPTCTTMGKSTYTPGVFQNSAFYAEARTIEDIQQLNHQWSDPRYSWNDDYTLVSAECICKNDDNHVLQETVETEKIENVPSTCQEPGHVIYQTKPFESEAFTVQRTMIPTPVGDHSKVVDDEAKKATCTTPGFTEASHCSVCGVIISEKTELPLLPHAVVIDEEAKEATCTTPGYTEASHCSVCGAIISEKTEIPLIPHTVEIDEEAKEATCTTPGHTEASHCSVCGAVISAKIDIPLLPHTVVIDPYVAPTINSTGLTEGAHCSDCGAILIPQEIIDSIGVKLYSSKDQYLVHEKIQIEMECETATEFSCVVQIYNPDKSFSHEIGSWDNTINATDGKAVFSFAVHNSNRIAVVQAKACVNGQWTEIVEKTIMIEEAMPIEMPSMVVPYSVSIDSSVEFSFSEVEHASEYIWYLINSSGTIIQSGTVNHSGATEIQTTDLKAGIYYISGQAYGENGWDDSQITGLHRIALYGQKYPGIISSNTKHIHIVDDCYVEIPEEFEMTIEDKNVYTLPNSDIFFSVQVRDNTYDIETLRSYYNNTENVQVINQYYINGIRVLLLIYPLPSSDGTVNDLRCMFNYGGKGCEFSTSYFESDENGYIIGRIITDSLNKHTLVVDNAIAPTCVDIGLTEGNHCSICSRPFIAQSVIPALGHIWTDPVYTWSEDNSLVTAKRICERDEHHIEEEIVEAVKWIEPPTETQEGFIKVFTLPFKNSGFVSQEKIVNTIPSLSNMSCLQLPSGIKIIEEEAFSGSSCQAILIPSECERIEKDAFANCPNLTYVLFNENTVVDDEAFSGCPILQQYYYFDDGKIILYTY